MKTKVFIYFFAGIFLYMLGCKPENGIEPTLPPENDDTVSEVYPKIIETIPYTLPDSSCQWTTVPWDSVKKYAVTGNSSYLYIVNSQTELNTILKCNGEMPTIDFEKYSLARLNISWSTEGNVSYNFIQTDSVSYYAEAYVTGLPAANPVYPYSPVNIPVNTHFLIPKLSKKNIVALDIQRNMNLEGWRVLKTVIDSPAVVKKHCYDMYAITDSFSVSDNVYIDSRGKRTVFTYNYIPDGFREEGLRVLVSGKIYDYPTMNSCDIKPFSDPAPTYMLHLDSIKLNPN